MHADLDMSGRVEETNKPTILAIANGFSFSLFISAQHKRQIIAVLLKRKPLRSKTIIHVLTFSVLVFLLLKNHLKYPDEVTIDLEYKGYESMIKNKIMSLCKKYNLKITEEQIQFQSVGKKSPAHNLAITIFRKKKEADRVVTAKEFLEM